MATNGQEAILMDTTQSVATKQDIEEVIEDHIGGVPDDFIDFLKEFHGGYDADFDARSMSQLAPKWLDSIRAIADGTGTGEFYDDDIRDLVEKAESEPI